MSDLKDITISKIQDKISELADELSYLESMLNPNLYTERQHVTIARYLLYESNNHLQEVYTKISDDIKKKKG